MPIKVIKLDFQSEEHLDEETVPNCVQSMSQHKKIEPVTVYFHGGLIGSSMASIVARPPER